MVFVHVARSSLHPVDVEDLGDGRYNVSYYATVAGNYSLSVTVGSVGVHRDFGFYNVEEVFTSSSRLCLIFFSSFC
jgi:hypothetical protein